MSLEDAKQKSFIGAITLTQSYYEDKVDFVEVIAYQSEVALTQVATMTGRSDFYLMDIRKDGVTRVHWEVAVGGKACLMDASLSPDLTRMAFRPNPIYARDHCIERLDDKIRILEFGPDGRLGHMLTVVGGRPRDGRRGSVVRTLLEGNASEVIFTFNPKYKHSRLIVANTKRGDTRQVSQVDVKSQVALAEAELVSVEEERYAQRLAASPGGEYLAVLIRFGAIQNTPPFYLTDVHIFFLDRLRVAYVVRQPGVECVNGFDLICPAAIFPMFSANGGHLAVGIGTTLEEEDGTLRTTLATINVHQVPVPVNLQVICRTKIRSWISARQVDRLKTSEAIKKYLQYVPLDT